MNRTLVKSVTALVLSVIVVIFGVSVIAHEMSYKGTVVSVDAKKLVTRVVDDTTKKESNMTFDITAATKIYRGKKIVTFEAARIAKEERVVVTINHDEPGDKALEIRLAAAK